ncbi:MAG TPA: hypothetical protein VKZ49_08680 [Polyangiaceae bacterium]|nr:hypothetical protein [Polyangiaceae bacterium]
MKDLFRSGVLLPFGVAALLFGSGCEVECNENEEQSGSVCVAKSLKLFEGAKVTEEVDYAEGGSLTIDGARGEIRVVEGTAGSVAVTFSPFTNRAYDTPAEEWQAEIDSLSLEATTDGSDVSIVVSRPSGSNATLGASMVVSLPPEFDGVLELLPNVGDAKIDYTAQAADVIVRGQELGDIEARLTNVPPQALFETEGDFIHLELPADGVFNVQALAREAIGDDDGIVTVNAPGCDVAEASPGAKTVSCNGATAADPVYNATATGLSPEIKIDLY